MNYNKYINSDEWHTRRDAYLSSHPNCESPLHANYSVEATEVNHLTYENMGNEKDEDLQALCEACHKKIHTNFSFDKNRTVEIGALNEMLSFYYNSRKNKDGVWYLFANTISDYFYDGRKLLNVFDNNTSNFFFQNVLQDILNKDKIDELYHLFETKIRNVKSYGYAAPSVTNATTTKVEEPVEKKEDDFDFDREYSFSEFLTLSLEEKNEIESHYELDEDYDKDYDYKVDVTDYSLSKLKSFINVNYTTKFYNLNIYFNREGLTTAGTISWFIKSKSSNYLSFLILKNM